MRVVSSSAHSFTGSDWNSTSPRRSVTSSCTISRIDAAVRERGRKQVASIHHFGQHARHVRARVLRAIDQRVAPRVGMSV